MTALYYGEGKLWELLCSYFVFRKDGWQTFLRPVHPETEEVSDFTVSLPTLLYLSSSLCLAFLKLVSSSKKLPELPALRSRQLSGCSQPTLEY